MTSATWFAVFLAGGLGALLRCLLAGAVQQAVPGFPLGTAVVNVLGCAGFGLCAGLGHGHWPALTQAAVLGGLFGGFTTFSSFAGDVVRLLEHRRWFAAAADLLGQNALGLLALAAGLWLGERWGRG